MLKSYSKYLHSKGNGNTLLKRYAHTNYYELLHLSKKCTAKDIRNSFVYLTKKYHPDRTDNKTLHAQFVKIVEAYNVLSKPESRQAYDRALSQASMSYASMPLKTNTNIKYTYYQYQAGRDPWDDPHFWHNRKDNKQNYDHMPYYGIKGFEKVSNSVVVFLCCIFAGLGFALQMFAIRNSLTAKRANMIKVSNEAEENLRVLRDQVKLNGNDLQLQIVKERFRLDEKRRKENSKQE